LQQIVNKEKSETFLETKKNKFKYKDNIIVEGFANNCLISSKEPNNIWATKSQIPIKIESIFRTDKIYVVGRRLLNLESFFEDPIDSSILGIFKTNFTLGEKEMFSFMDLKYKFLCLPFESEFLIMPILHSCLPEKCQTSTLTPQKEN